MKMGVTSILKRWHALSPSKKLVDQPPSKVERFDQPPKKVTRFDQPPKNIIRFDLSPKKCGKVD